MKRWRRSFLVGAPVALAIVAVAGLVLPRLGGSDDTRVRLQQPESSTGEAVSDERATPWPLFAVAEWRAWDAGGAYDVTMKATVAAESWSHWLAVEHDVADDTVEGALPPASYLRSFGVIGPGISAQTEPLHTSAEGFASLEALEAAAAKLPRAERWTLAGDRRLVPSEAFGYLAVDRGGSYRPATGELTPPQHDAVLDVVGRLGLERENLLVGDFVGDVGHDGYVIVLEGEPRVPIAARYEYEPGAFEQITVTQLRTGDPSVAALLARVQTAAADAPLPASAITDRLEVTCTEDGVIVEGAEVRAGPAGVEVHFGSRVAEGADPGWGWSYMTVDGGAGGGLDPDGDTTLVLPLHPGDSSTVGCAPLTADAGGPQWEVTVTVRDPGDVWRDTTLACAEVIGVSYAVGDTASREQATQLATDALTSYFDDVNASEVMRLGYPEASAPVFGLVREGRTVARLLLSDAGEDRLTANGLDYCDPDQW